MKINDGGIREFLQPTNQINTRCYTSTGGTCFLPTKQKSVANNTIDTEKRKYIEGVKQMHVEQKYIITEKEAFKEGPHNSYLQVGS